MELAENDHDDLRQEIEDRIRWTRAQLRLDSR
jgi:hypothetical protein